MKNIARKLNYKHTVLACFIGYVVQAIVCNFAPLLFVSWNNEFNITIPQTTVIIALTFIVQILVDLIAVKYVDKIGYKVSLVLAHIFAGVGFIVLGAFVPLVKNHFVAIIIAVILYSMGSGLLEVLVSPVVDSCPSDNKAGAMSLLHSFYCWGTVFVIAFSSVFFYIFGRDNWSYLSILWAIISFLNAVFFMLVPIKEPHEDSKKEKVSSLLKNKVFIFAIIVMICSGASELAMSQWASSFAEKGLNVSKTVGDLAGPMAFAVLMGIGRVIFSKVSNKISIEKYLIYSALLCIASYFVASLSPVPIISLIGCAVCGFAVSAMWPGTISLTSAKIPTGSTAMFALLAFSGDIGCTVGPSVVGWVSNAFSGDIKKGLLFGFVFPVIIVICLLLQIKNSKCNHKIQ